MAASTSPEALVLSTLAYPGHSRQIFCAEQVNSGFPNKLVPPSTKIHPYFSPTNAPGDPNGRRSPEFTSIRTSVSVFMDALSKARMVRKNQRWLAHAMAMSASESKKIPDKIPPVGSARRRAPDLSRASPDAVHILCSRTRSQALGWSLKLMIRGA